MVGFGYDVHRLASGESLVLAGVAIPSELGTVAHSDGDVLVHAICDALLGSLGLGDIGEHFPDTSDEWKGVSSMLLLSKVKDLVDSESCFIVNIDCTLVLEQPKILPYKQEMRQNLAEVLSLPLRRVSLKATTSEKVGFVGNLEGVQAYCVCEVREA